MRDSVELTPYGAALFLSIVADSGVHDPAAHRSDPRLVLANRRFQLKDISIVHLTNAHCVGADMVSA